MAERLAEHHAHSVSSRTTTNVVGSALLSTLRTGIGDAFHGRHGRRLGLCLRGVLGPQ